MHIFRIKHKKSIRRYLHVSFPGFFLLFICARKRVPAFPGRSRAFPCTAIHVVRYYHRFYSFSLNEKKKTESQSASGGERGRGKLQKLAIIDNRSLLFPIQHNPELTLRTSEAMINSRIFSHQTFAPFYMLSLGIKFLLHQRTL